MIIHPSKKRAPDEGEDKSNRITVDEVLAMFKKHILLLSIGVAVIGYFVYRSFSP